VPDIEEPDEDDPNVEEICSNCGKGIVQVVDLKYVVFKVCNLCNAREKIQV
jgi:hypothetical protein